jgi:NosR/NirI family nitrous oxide reductase transcriptional regulator
MKLFFINKNNYDLKTLWSLRAPWFKKPIRFVLLFIMLFFFILAQAAAEPTDNQYRFPRPEFRSDYRIPELKVPEPSPDFFEYLDLLVLALTLGMVSYLALKRRSRWGIFLFSLFSIIYFGFIRRGCICPIGSIQNITLAILDPLYAIPLTIIGFFLLPLFFTLLFGRSFCAGVCPFGALQDLVIYKPIRLPVWLSQSLGLIPYIYLATAVLFTATGSGFLICRFDPFVEIFRFGSRPEMLAFGAVLLLIGIFVARPYCRFLCPYSVLLKVFSRFSIWHTVTTPDDCLNCRLCEESCPIDAILPPTTLAEPENRELGIRRLFLLIVLIPVISGGGALGGAQMARVLAHFNYDVSLRSQIAREESLGSQNYSEDSLFFRETKTSLPELSSLAGIAVSGFYTGGWFWGGFIGLVFALKLVSLSLWRKREHYQTDKAQCVSCGRCFSSCPKEAQRRKMVKEKYGTARSES